MTRPLLPPGEGRQGARSQARAVRLFQLDSPLTGEILDERSLMAFPLFARSNNAWMKPLFYEHGPVSMAFLLLP